MRQSLQTNLSVAFLAAAALAACEGDKEYFIVDSGMTDGEVTPDGNVPDGSVPDGTVTPMPRGEDNPPTLGAQLDRVGRPAISTALVGTFMADDDMKGALKDAYNSNGDPSTWAATFAGPMAGSLAILDALDANCGDQLLVGEGAGAYGALAGALADDRLYVNTSSGVCTGTYLGVEAEALAVLEDGGCGGRAPNEDVIERSYSVLASGALGGIDDTIAEDAADHSMTDFPFIAGPN